MSLVVRSSCLLRPASLVGVVMLAGAASATAADVTIAEQVSDAVASVQQSPDRTATLAPEVSSVRTRLGSTMVPAMQMPDGRVATDLAGVDYRLWMNRGRAGIGVGIGTLGYVQPSTDGRIDGPVHLTGAAPTLSVGVRMRMSPESSVYADATGARGFRADPDARFVNTKVGVEWKPAKSRFGFEGGRLALQLDSGYRLSLRARKGGVGVYLRGQF